MAVCHYHPDRLGIGICVRCRVVICSACCTKLDGVNHCHACLSKLGRGTERQGVRQPPAALGAVAVWALGGLLFFALGLLLSGMLGPAFP